MSYDHALHRAVRELHTARALIAAEMQAYPTPISGCDAQYNHLIGQRSAISQALSVLETPPFVATPRSPDASAGIESR